MNMSTFVSGETAPNSTSHLAKWLGEIKHNPATNEQWHMLRNIGETRGLANAYTRYAESGDKFAQTHEVYFKKHEAISPSEFVTSLLDFAADPNSSSSLLVRAQALEVGMDEFHRAKLHSQKNHQPLPSALADIEAGLSSVFDGHVGEPMGVSHYGIGSSGDTFMWATRALIEFDNFDSDCVFPDWHEYSFDPIGQVNPLPYFAGKLVNRLINDPQTGTRFLPPAVIHDAFKTALDFRGSEYQEALSPQSHINQFSKLARLTRSGGFEHDEPIEYFYSLPKEEGIEYAKLCNNLYDAAAGLREVFPEAVAEDVAHGAQALAANALFALRHHHQNNFETNTEIGLKFGGALPVEYHGDEPMQTLRQLTDALKHLRTTVTSPNTKTIKSAEGKGFVMYRLIDTTTDIPPSVAVYLRSAGDVAFDPHYEFGRPGVGVEATINYMVDTSGGLPVLEKRGRSPQSISIRLDREGELPGETKAQRDPTREDGSISLDVGSILSDPASLDARVGRLLALGNVLYAQKAQKEAGLNHVQPKDQTFGQAEAFASLARAVKGQCSERGLTMTSLVRLFAHLHAA